VRDLSQDQHWQQSLERSRARREQRRADEQRRAASQGRPREPRHAGPRPSAARGLSAAVALSAIALVIASVVAVAGPSGSHTRGARPLDVLSASAGTTFADSGHTAFAHGGDGIGIGHGRAGSCHPVSTATGYTNPLAHAHVKGERIDQGVDYAGTGKLTAIGPAKITEVGTEGTGWPGAFIEYQLMNGPSAGCFVFYAEGVEPVTGLHKGQTVPAGQEIATIIEGWSTGIELGWGAGRGTTTYAAQTSGWTPDDDAANVASPAGLSFSALVAALGGPAGKIEGGPAARHGAARGSA
jgi:hypothetical protein